MIAHIQYPPNIIAFSIIHERGYNCVCLNKCSPPPPPLFFFFCRNWRSFCSTWRRAMLRWVHASVWLNVAECCWLNRQRGAGGTQMSQSVSPNLNMTSAASLAIWSRLAQSASCRTFTNTEVNTCAADYSSNVLKYYLKFCCKVHWNTMIATYTGVNLHFWTL